MNVQLSLADAKTVALNVQGLVTTPAKSSLKDVQAVLPSLGAVQLDTISTLARSHELVHYSRTHGISRQQVEVALWADSAPTFEYWSHAACVLPIDMYPWFAARRRAFAARKSVWHNMPSSKTLKNIRKRLGDGPATATDMGGAKAGGQWWSWSETKEGLEWLLAIGDVVCTKRVGWRRVYSLTEMSIPSEFTSDSHWVTRQGVYGPSDQECVEQLILDGMRSLGVGTMSDLADVHRVSGHHATRAQVTKAITNLVESHQLTPVSVEGWSEATYASPEILSTLAKGKLTTGSTTTLLSPFDSLVWHRDRVSRLFDMEYRLEAYTPAAKRVYGYFAMPVLHNGNLIARVDPGRENQGRVKTFVAKTVTFESSTKPKAADISGVAQALVRAGSWIAADDIRIDTVKPESVRTALTTAVRKAL